jgi:hypothetical protein
MATLFVCHKETKLLDPCGVAELIVCRIHHFQGAFIAGSDLAYAFSDSDACRID